MKKIPNWLFYFGIVILGVYLLVRLIDMSQIIFFFPLSNSFDIPTYMGYLYLLHDVGYHHIVPYWFNGSMTLFLQYPPGFFYVALPIYLLTKSVEFSTYIMLPIMYLIIFITFWIFAIKTNIPKIKMTFFYLIFLASPFAIGNFVRLGRVVELFGWAFMIILIFVLYYYLERPVDKYFFLMFIPAYVILLLSHPAIITLFHLSCIPIVFFFLSDKRGKLFLMISMLVGLLLTSFWWVSFLQAVFNENSILDSPFTYELLRFDRLSYVLTNIASIVISIIMFILFYLFWISKNKDKKIFFFFLPILVVNSLVLTRLIVLVPFLNSIFPDIYNLFFIFFAMLFFVKINFALLKPWLISLTKVALVFVPLVFVLFSALYTPYFVGHTPLEEEILELLPQVEGKYLLFRSSSPTSHPPSYYIYGMIYHNLSTAYGGLTYGSITNEYRLSFFDLEDTIENSDCETLIYSLEELDVSSLILFYNDDCQFLETCGMELKKQGEYSCLYILK